MCACFHISWAKSTNNSDWCCTYSLAKSVRLSCDSIKFENKLINDFAAIACCNTCDFIIRKGTDISWKSSKIETQHRKCWLIHVYHTFSLHESISNHYLRMPYATKLDVFLFLTKLLFLSFKGFWWSNLNFKHVNVDVIRKFILLPCFWIYCACLKCVYQNIVIKI